MTTTSRIAGGVRNPVADRVSADQDTIVGDGTSDNPLRATTGVFLARLTVVADIPARLGQFMAVHDDDPTPPALTTVLQGSAQANPLGVPHVVGVVTAVADDGLLTLQSVGVVTLPASAWDVVTGGSGGLIQGAPYYLSSTAPGELVVDPPTASTTWVVQVGVALSATAMAIALPGAVAQN